jgi:tetratricopeptide (TPR) repeat protein
VTGDAERKARYTESDDPKRLVELDRALHQAVELAEQGRADEARVVYQRILTERPDMAIAYRHLAFVQWASGDPRGAVNTLRDAMAKGLGDASMRTQLGTYLAEAGAEREAIALLEHIDVLTADADTVNALGIAYARAGRSADALRTFEAVLARGPNATALQNMGSVYLATGENTRARDVLERAVALESRAAPAWTGLGVAHLRLGDRDAAVTSWRHAVAADPREFNALYNLAIELHGRGDPEGRRLLERFVQTAPPAFYAADIAHIRRLLSGSGAARP